MEYALPNAWTQGSRGFWSKRKKSATSLMAALAMVAGIAVAYKLFEQNVPNNVVRDASSFNYEVHVARTVSQGCSNTVAGDTSWCHATGTDPVFQAGVDSFPGDSRTQQARIRNTHTTPARDASFVVFVDQASITVRGCTLAADGSCSTTPTIAANSAEWNSFVGFWDMSVAKEKVLRTPAGQFPESKYIGDAAYVEACSPNSLKQYTRQAPCELGVVRAAGKNSPNGDRLDQRGYKFTMAERDTAQDQSAFKGWTITYTLSFAAKVGSGLTEPSNSPVD